MNRKGKIFVSALGMIFITFGVAMITLNLQMIGHGHQLEGRIVGYESRAQSIPNRGIHGSTDAPLVEFQYEGETLRIPAQKSSAWHGFEIGDSATLYFDPAERDEVILDSFYQKYGFGSLFVLCGLLQFLAVWAFGKSRPAV